MSQQYIHGSTIDLKSEEHSQNDPVQLFESEESSDHLKYRVPHRLKQKVTSASDAVELVRNGDTICVSGFVTQGSPEAILKALGERFEENATPKDLTLLFGGGPGDHGNRGLSHLAKEKDIGDDKNVCMLKRTIGGHYGQIPLVSLCFQRDYSPTCNFDFFIILTSPAFR
jgi:hypothetical protein